MGASAGEIEQQIRQTRERMDENLEALEHRAASGAVRVGKIAAFGAGAAAVAAVGFVVWRKTRRRTLRARLERVSPDSLRALALEVASRLKKQLPSVRVNVNEPRCEPGMVQSILRQAVPAVVGTASTVLIERLARPAQATRDPSAASR